MASGLIASIKSPGKGYERVSEGLYRKTTPANRKPNEKGKDDTKKKKDQQDTVRGKEITVSESSSEGQVIYGKMMVGGVKTFVDTSQESAAYLITGDEGDENQLVFTARTAGAGGNDLTIEIEGPTSWATTVCNYFSGGHIKITCRTNGAGVIQATLNEVIAAVQANAPSWSLINVQKLVAGTNSAVVAVAETNLSYGGGSWLHHIITLAGHDIDQIEKLYLDGEEVTFGASPDGRWGTGVWANRVFMSQIGGETTQEAQADLMSQLPALWTSDHKQLGCAGCYLILVWDENLFSQGYPEISFLVRGKKMLDPRTDVYAYSDNAAVCTMNFLMDGKFGYGIPRERIHTATVNASADVCDQLVGLVSGSEKRYTCNGAFDMGPRDEVLRQLKQAMAGDVFESGGMYYIIAGSYQTPDLTLGPDDLRGELVLDTHVDRGEVFNCVRGTFVSAADNYNETDFPAVKNSTYVTEDGAELWADFAFNFVTSPNQCQRIAKIELEKIRQGQTFTWPGKMTCFKARVGGSVTINYPRWGITSKVCQVMDVKPAIEQDGNLGCDLLLRERPSSVYDWADGSETTFDPSPNTTLPDPTLVNPPTNLQLFSGTAELYIRGDGTVAPRIRVTWDGSSTNFVIGGGKYEVEWKLSADSVWNTFDVSGAVGFCYLTDVKDGILYDVRVRAKNTLNVKSSYVTQANYTCIGKQEPPSDVTNFNAALSDFGVVFTWDSIPDLDRDEYEIRVGADFATGISLWRGKGNTYRWEHKAASTYNFWIKAYDTSNNPSDVATEFELIINAPTAPVVTAVLDGPNVKFSWSASTANFAIKEYEIRYGTDFASGTAVAIATAQNYTLRVNWGGARTFWIAGRDIADNTGAGGSVAVTIANPNVIEGLNAKTEGANVMLDWQEPVPSSLPIAEYHIYKGETYIVSLLLGVVYGTFHTYIEQLGGAFGYHVISVDTAGNFSTEVSVVATVTIPDNFFIRSELELVNSGDVSIIDEVLLNARRVLINPTETPEVILFPTGATGPGASLPWLFGIEPGSGAEETWDQWWDNNGWVTWQDAIDAGYDAVFPTPTNTQPGYIEWTVNYGVLFSSSFIDLTWVITALGEGATITSSISISDDNLSYTTYAGASQLFAENFQYVKYRIAFVGLDNKSLCQLQSATATLSLQLEEEVQNVACLAADVDGTYSAFTKDFLDVQSIQATAVGLLFATVVVNPDYDVPDPTGYKMKVFDKDGNRIDYLANARIKGAVNPV